MVQPPYPPPGGNAPGADDPGAQPWSPPSDETTQQIGPLGGSQREPTRRLPQPGQYAPPGQYGPPSQYGAPGPYAPQGQYGPPGQYGAPGPYAPQGQYGPPGHFPPPGQYAAPDLYAQPVHWQPWGAPGATAAPRRGKRNTVIALVVAGVLGLAVGVALFLFFGTDANRPAADGGRNSGDSGLPAATTEPDGLGEDPVLNQLAQSCYDGDMRACDRLYDRSDAGSDYETYGDTCAGRQPSGTFVYCTETFPED